MGSPSPPHPPDCLPRPLAFSVIPLLLPLDWTVSLSASVPVQAHTQTDCAVQMSWLSACLFNVSHHLMCVCVKNASYLHK